MQEPQATWDHWSPQQDGHVLTWLRHLVTAIAALSFIATLLTTLGGLAVRYLGIRGFEWTFELAAISFLWTSFFGVLLAEIRKENVAFTVFADMLHGRKRTALALATGVLMFILALVLLDSGLAFLQRSGSAPTPVLRLPRAVQIFPFICFATGLCLILLLRFIDALRKEAR